MSPGRDGKAQLAIKLLFDPIYHATHPATKSDKSLDKDCRLAFECYLIWELLQKS